jgi:hypothetical protein
MGKDSLERTDEKGLGQESLHRTAEKGNLEKTVRMRQAGQEREDRTART